MNDAITQLSAQVGVPIKPTIKLPGEGVTVTDTAKAIYEVAGVQNGLFYSNGRVVRISRVDKTAPEQFEALSASQAVSEFEKYGSFVGGTGKGKVMAENTAKLILEADVGREILPNVKLILSRPLLMLQNGLIDTLNIGYNPESMVYVLGGSLQEPDSLDEAVDLVQAPFVDFSFKTDGDYSRAIALMLTPALKIGGFISDHTPIDIVEASESQTGKGHLLHLRCLVYGEQAVLVVRQKGGTGSPDESLSAAILSGRPFIQIDNLRGGFSSELLEAFLTNPGHITVRVPYSKVSTAEGTNRFFAITSNGVEITEDLANRASFVRLIKEKDREFSLINGLPIEQIIRRQHSSFSGAIAKVIRHYHSLGMPKTGEKRHARREWAQTLDWIVQKIFELPPLLDGMEEVKARTVNPALGFVRELAIQIEKCGKLGHELRPSELADIYTAAGLVVPGLDKSEEVDYNNKQEAQRVGQLMKQAMKDGDELVVEGYKVTRSSQKRIVPSGALSDANFYRFELMGEPRVTESKAESSIDPQSSSEGGGEPDEKQAQQAQEGVSQNI